MTQSARVGSTDAALTKVVAGTEGAYTNSTGAAGTATVAQLIDGFWDQASGTPGTLTTPTAAQIVAAIPGCAVGSKFEFTVLVRAAAGGTLTVAGGTGVTGQGTLTVAATPITSVFKFVVTNATLASEAVIFGIVK